MDDRGFEAMNVVPLVDVMMVLLVIVLMTSTFIVSGMIPVELPKATTSDSKKIAETATVVIDRAGIVHFQSMPTTLGELQEKMGKLDRRTPVIVRADRHVMVQNCVDVLDLLSKNRFQKVALQTERATR